MREPQPGQQAAALWAYSSLAVALSDSSRPLYQQLPTPLRTRSGTTSGPLSYSPLPMSWHRKRPG